MKDNILLIGTFITTAAIGATYTGLKDNAVVDPNITPDLDGISISETNADPATLNSTANAGLAIGKENTANHRSAAIGEENTALTNSISVGFGNYSYNRAATFGSGNNSNGYSFAAGLGNDVHGVSHAVGDLNNVRLHLADGTPTNLNSRSTAIGRLNNIEGRSSVAVGISNVIKPGDQYTVTGDKTIIPNRNNVAVGRSLIIDDSETVATGRYNDPTVKDLVFVVGSGTAGNQRRNSIEVGKDGRVEIKTEIKGTLTLSEPQGDILSGNYQ